MKLEVDPHIHAKVIEQLKGIQNVSTHDIQQFVIVCGERRLKQYCDNNYNLKNIYRYLDGTLDEKKIITTKMDLRALESNILLIEMLQNKGAKTVLSEVPIEGTVIDAVADLSGDEHFNVITKDLILNDVCLREGLHTFEVKARRRLDDKKYIKTQEKKEEKQKNKKQEGPREDKVIKQIKYAVGHYKDCKRFVKAHVVVARNTTVTAEINDKINEMGADIIRMEVTLKELQNRVEEMRELFELFKRGYTRIRPAG